MNIGTGNPRFIRGIAETLIERYGKSDELSPEIADDFRQGDIRHCYADTSRAKDLLGFEPTVNFTEGMRELVEWCREQDAENRFDQAHAELEERDLVGEG